MSEYRYLKGSKDSREAVEFDVIDHGQYITTCVVDVDLMYYGSQKFPCGNGDDITLTLQQQLDILELVRAERKKLTTGMEVKTMADWHNSGLSFDNFCFPGDTVSDDIVGHFINSVPPVLLRADCTQAREPYSCEADEAGNHRPTYTTFHRSGKGRWQYDGCCFYGENRNRAPLTYNRERLRKRIIEIWNETSA